MFRPSKNEEGTPYRIRIAQEAAVEIVNRLTGGMTSGKNDWYVPFTYRDANVLRRANKQFLNDCVERMKCERKDKKGNRKWQDLARLRRSPMQTKK